MSAVNFPHPLRRVYALLEALERRQLLSATFFSQNNLVSDGAVPALHIDKNLVNPWGIAADDQGPVWIADNGTSKATTYDFETGKPAPLVVNIAGAEQGHGVPTGELYNQAENAFVIHKGNKSGVSKFIFAGEDGTISAWSPQVDLHNTVVVADRSAQGAVFKGLAQADAHGKAYIYATDFVNGRVDVFNANFNQTGQFGNFIDPQVPSDFHPFGIQAIDAHTLVVTYAKNAPGEGDEVHGDGFGFATVFSSDGKVLKRLQHTSLLNAPWGVAVAPKSWKGFAGDLLIGQFATGKIVAYDRTSGQSRGTLNDKNGHPIAIDGLWGLRFGNANKNDETLFFTAGINDEADGLFGNLKIHPGT